MVTLALIHPGNPNLLELYGVLAGFLLILLTIDLAIDLFKKKPWKKLHGENGDIDVTKDPDAG